MSLSGIDWFKIEMLPEGSELPDVPCEWQDYEEGMYARDIPKCGVVPTLKSEFHRHYYCKMHLEAAREYMKKVDAQRKVKSMVIKMNLADFRTRDTMVEAIAHQIPLFKEPRFRSGVFGRTWDSLGRTDQNEKILVDTTWGHTGYFRRSGVLYKVDLYNKDDEKSLARLKTKGGQNV